MSNDSLDATAERLLAKASDRHKELALDEEEPMSPSKEHHQLPRNRFKNLEKELKEFDYAPVGLRAKESFTKGSSPKLVLGETRTNVLSAPHMEKSSSASTSFFKSPIDVSSSCANTTSPTVSSAEAHRVRFASPVAAATINDESLAPNPVRCSIIEENENEVSWRVPSSLEQEEQDTQTIVESELNEDSECGISSLVARKSPRHSTVVKSIILHCQSQLSPLTFYALQKPTSTSSPLIGVESKKASGDDQKKKIQETPPLTNSARSIARLFELRCKEQGVKVVYCVNNAPTPRLQSGSHSTLDNEQRLKAVRPSGSAPVTLSQGVHWAPNTVAMTLEHRSSERSLEKGNPNTTFPTVNNLKELRNRWEVSSSTGITAKSDVEKMEEMLLSTKSSPHGIIEEKKEEETEESPSSRIHNSSTASSLMSPGRIEALVASPLTRSFKVDSCVKRSLQTGSRSPSPVNRRALELSEEDDNKEGVDRPESPTITQVTTPVQQHPSAEHTFKYGTTSPVTPLEIKALEEALEGEKSGPSEDEEGEETQKVPSPELTLPHSVSFYRRVKTPARANDARVPSLVFGLTPSTQPDPATTATIADLVAANDRSKEIEAEKTYLKKALLVQEQLVVQSQHALAYCRERSDFRGSSGEAEAHKALLIAVETRRAIRERLAQLEEDRERAKGPRGALHVASVALVVANKGLIYNSSCSLEGETVYYFAVLVKCDGVVANSRLMSSDDAAARRGLLEYELNVDFVNLAPDFRASVEVYVLKLHRELRETKESKWKTLKGGSGKKMGTLRGGTFTGSVSTTLSSTSSELPPVSEGFRLAAVTVIDVKTKPERKTSIRLADPAMPLEPSIAIKFKKMAVEKTPREYRGFLSLYQKTADGLGAWQRFYCVLTAENLKFFRRPEDEDNRSAISVALNTCTEAGVKAVPSDRLTYPNSMELQVWAPSKEKTPQGKPKFEILSVMLAADHKVEMTIWLQKLNDAISEALLWD